MKLLPHQQRVLKEISDRWGIWHDVGLGKTTTAVSLIFDRLTPNERALVVTTKSLVHNWQREIRVLSTGITNIPSINVVTKEQLRKDHKKLGKFDAVIFDEAHYAAYMTSQIHKAFAWYLGTHKPRCIWLLTATPILSNVMSVWGLSRLLGRPLGSYQRFRAKYFYEISMNGRSVPVQKKGIERQIANDLRLIGDVVSKEDVTTEHESIHEVEYFELNDKQKEEIRDLDNDPTTATPIVYHTKSLQIANGTLKKGQRYIEIPCAKMDRVLELVDQNPSCVIVARQTAELHLLHAKIPNSFIYNGETPKEDRDAIIEKVNNGEGVLLLQCDTAVGFNLPNIRTIIYYSHSWSYVSYYQSLGRNGGLRQKGTNTYVHLVTENTVDESVWECLQGKRDFDVALYNRV